MLKFNDGKVPFSVLGYSYWLEIELMNSVGLIITNVLFLVIRSFIRVKIPIENCDDKTQLPTSETVVVYKEIINAFSS